MIYKTITLDEMINLMGQANRDNFTLEAYEVIYDYLEDSFTSFEFNAVKIDGMFCEYNSHADFLIDYDSEDNPDIIHLWKLNNGSYLVLI